MGKHWQTALLAGFVALGACTPAATRPVDNPPDPAGEQQPPWVRRARTAPVEPARFTQSPRTTLEVFRDVSLPLERDSMWRTRHGTVWVGHVAGQPGSTALFVIRDQIVVGNVTTGAGQVYDLRYAGGGLHRFREIDQSRFPPDGEPTAPRVEPRDPQADPCATTDPGTEIDVMVVYNAASAAAAGGAPAMEAEVVLAVEATNQAYINSNVNQRLNLVHTEQVTYTETGSAVTDRNRLQNPSDTFIDNVHSLRDSHGADVVALITNTPTDFCGYAYIMQTVSTSFEPFAFTAVKRDCSVSNLSFAHELAHIMGARHDWPNDGTNNSPYAFNHGHNSPNAPLRRTIMSTSLAGGRARIQWFSNPNLNYPGTSDPMGTAAGSQQADNHQTLNNTALTVANFRCTSPGVGNVWAKDTWNDTGAEPDPNTAADPMWTSPYIWVRTTADPALVHQHVHENPVMNDPNFAYVKLHNGGGTTSGTLNLYVADASASLVWSAGWTLIGSVPIASFAGHTTRVVEIPWTPTASGHFCLMARWVSATDPMTVPEGPDINANTRNNNNIVWRNVNVVDLGHDVLTQTVQLRMSNVERIPRAYSLLLRTTPSDRHSFLRDGEVTVTLDDVLARAWAAGGSRATGITRTAGGLRAGEGAALDNIVLRGGEGGNVRVTFTRSPATPRRTYHVDVIQLGSGRDSTRTGNEVRSPPPAVIGGVSYEIRAEISHP